MHHMLCTYSTDLLMFTFALDTVGTRDTNHHGGGLNTCFALLPRMIGLIDCMHIQCLQRHFDIQYSMSVNLATELHPRSICVRTRLLLFLCLQNQSMLKRMGAMLTLSSNKTLTQTSTHSFNMFPFWLLNGISQMYSIP